MPPFNPTASDRPDQTTEAMTSGERSEPQVTLDRGDTQVTLLGTAHVSRASADKVRALLESGEYDAVAIELCPSRYDAILNPDSLAKMDLFAVMREGKVPMVAASLALGAYQQRLAEQFGIEPGAEMRAAIEAGKARHIPVLLIDREIGVTLKRVYRNVPWWSRLTLVAGLFASILSRERVEEAEIERLKEGDILETAFVQFAEEAEDLYEPLIDERDRYMAARIQQEVDASRPRRLLAVVGAGHLKGIQSHLASDVQDPQQVLDRLDTVPASSRWPRLIPWLVVIVILMGFGIGFLRNPELGWRLVLDWVVINGGLAGLGALAAAAHPMTVVTAFLAAPLTSLNPTIGAGMATAGMETFLRKPQVGDFSRLRTDTAHLKGWWRNRVSRILLVFLFSTLGSIAGTYIAGIKIFHQLFGA
jgi:pheromone shutdown-related protein TraB